MDFVRLGPRYSSAYIPDGNVIEGYSSLIWTERFKDFGEFEMKTFDVEAMMTLLPEDTLVSHLETDEVMIVETHEINMVGDGVDAVPELTIKGRSATNIFESRYVESSYQKKRRMRQKYSATGAAVVLMTNAVVNDSGYDVTRGDLNSETEDNNNYKWTHNENIPNSVVSEYVSSEGSTRWWQLEQGMLYPQLQAILADADLGIRCVRPMLPNNINVVTVDSALATRGTIRHTLTDNCPSLRFEVYDGMDRTSSVQLSLLQGHLTAPTYLSSSQPLRTRVRLKSGPNVVLYDMYRPGEGEFTGWKRKVMDFDAGQPELPAKPAKPAKLRSNATAAQRRAYGHAYDNYLDKKAAWQNKVNGIYDDFYEAQDAAAMVELKKAAHVDMFTGDVSDLAPYQYKTHYFLGDTVMLYGDYGRTSKMVVSEYVRTDDANGDRGFPGLVAPEP